MNEIEVNSKPQRAQGGWASFPDEFTYKVFTNPWLKSLTLERRGEERDRKEKGARLRERWCAAQTKKRESEGEGVFNPQQLSTQKTKLPLDSIKH